MLLISMDEDSQSGLESTQLISQIVQLALMISSLVLLCGSWSSTSSQISRSSTSLCIRVRDAPKRNWLFDYVYGELAKDMPGYHTAAHLINGKIAHPVHPRSHRDLCMVPVGSAGRAIIQKV